MYYLMKMLYKLLRKYDDLIVYHKFNYYTYYIYISININIIIDKNIKM
jgi:hypothetical protein